MLKQLSQELTVKKIIAESENKMPVCEIMLQGQATGKTVSGAVLEAAVSWQEFYLLFLSDDIPQEDMLNIHLLDKNLSPLDSAVVGNIYSTGSFSSLQLLQPNRVGFRFIGDTDWLIELLPKQVLRFPFITDPAGVRRRFGFSRYFKVHGNPQRQQAN
jgi:hypothetical protein